MIRKAVILCGGKATRFNNGKPGPLKALIKVNKKPILIKIMEIYIKSGVNEFILLGGYKFKELKKYFNKSKYSKNYKINILNTGLNTETAGRIIKAKKIIGKGRFFLTYGDSLTDYKPKKAFKKIQKKKNCFLISIFNNKIPYGVLNIKNNILKKYEEKKFNVYINAGFYIFDEKIYKYINSSKDSLEKKIIPKILKNNKQKISTYECNFWHPMDNRHDKIKLSYILKNKNNV